MTSAQLLNSLENACFQVANYPSRKTAHEQLRKLENEIAKRLEISSEDLEKIRRAEL